MKVKMKVLAVGVVTSSLCSCGMVLGTPSGIKQMGQTLTGLNVTAKSRPNELDEYHKTQRYEEEQKTLRIQLGRAK
jgi:uncharacterized membrane protein AbrB (regulator of aidB expression)